MHTLHRQTPFLQHVQMGATGHERNIRPTLGQEPTQIASEATTPHHDNTHRLSPLWRRISLARGPGMSSDSTNRWSMLKPFLFWQMVAVLVYTHWSVP